MLKSSGELETPICYRSSYHQPHRNAANTKDLARTFRRKPSGVLDIEAQQTRGESPVSLTEDA